MSAAAGTLRIATRQSRLALWQAEHVAARLREAHAGLVVNLVPMTTQGDRILDRSLALAVRDHCEQGAAVTGDRQRRPGRAGGRQHDRIARHGRPRLEPVRVFLELALLHERELVEVLGRPDLVRIEPPGAEELAIVGDGFRRVPDERTDAGVAQLTDSLRGEERDPSLAGKLAQNRQRPARLDQRSRSHRSRRARTKLRRRGPIRT